MSKGLLSEEYINKRIGYYPHTPMFSSSGRHDVPGTPFMPGELVEENMEMLFEYINSNNLETATDHYIKAAIIHYFFVYIHPYYDVNGRTSRTVSMSYLLEKKAYPYIIFNRGINFAKGRYFNCLENTDRTGNLDMLIEYMLIQVKIELEKEYLTILAEDSLGKLTPVERQAFNYILSMKGDRTFYDFATTHNRFNHKSSIKDISEKMIEPLIEKGFLYLKERTKNKGHNYFFEVNSKCMDFNPEEIKGISLFRK